MIILVEVTELVPINNTLSVIWFQESAFGFSMQRPIVEKEDEPKEGGEKGKGETREGVRGPQRKSFAKSGGEGETKCENASISISLSTICVSIYTHTPHTHTHTHHTPHTIHHTHTHIHAMYILDLRAQWGSTVPKTK
jgi:hypothetical protein